MALPLYSIIGRRRDIWWLCCQLCCAVKSPATIGLGTGALNCVYPPAPSTGTTCQNFYREADITIPHLILHDLTPSLPYTQTHGPNTTTTGINTESHMDPPSHHWTLQSHSDGGGAHQHDPPWIMLIVSMARQSTRCIVLENSQYILMS